MGAPLNVFGSKPAGSEGLVAFADKGFDGDDFRLIEHVGKAAIIRVHGPEQVNTKNGLKTAVKADVTVIGNDGNGQKYENVLIFNQVPVQQLSEYAGQTTVARIDTYETKQGNTAPKLDDATEADVKAATAILSGGGRQAEDPPF